jgi:hypothetical protein
MAGCCMPGCCVPLACIMTGDIPGIICCCIPGHAYCIIGVGPPSSPDVACTGPHQASSASCCLAFACLAGPRTCLGPSLQPHPMAAGSPAPTPNWLSRHAHPRHPEEQCCPSAQDHTCVYRIHQCTHRSHTKDTSITLATYKVVIIGQIVTLAS